MEWKDITSYSKGERGKVEPSTLELRLGERRVIICKHRDYSGEFIIRGYSGFDFDFIKTNTTELEKAKDCAIEFLKSYITNEIDELENIKSLLGKN